jgi:hypothetical protein
MRRNIQNPDALPILRRIVLLLDSSKNKKEAARRAALDALNAGAPPANTPSGIRAQSPRH